jgi:hypothetical protein
MAPQRSDLATVEGGGDDSLGLVTNRVSKKIFSTDLGGFPNIQILYFVLYRKQPK